MKKGFSIENLPLSIRENWVHFLKTPLVKSINLVDVGEDKVKEILKLSGNLN